MTIDLNDPRWTAYALGELDDARDRQELESVLRQSSEAREFVDQIRHEAASLSEALRAEPCVLLSNEQRNRIASRITRKSRFGMRPAWIAASLCTGIALALWITTYESQKQNRPDQKTVAAIQPATASAPRVIGQTAVQSQHIPAVPMQSPTAAVQKTKKTHAAITLPPLGPQGSQMARLMGTVKDPTGAVIPGAVVRVRNDSTGVTTQSTTDEKGEFLFGSLSPGMHTLTAQVPGFTTERITQMGLAAAESKTMDLRLELGHVTETVSVDSGAMQIQTALSRLAQPSAHPQDAMRAGRIEAGVFSAFQGVEGQAKEAPKPVLKDRRGGTFNTEAYDYISDNPFQDVNQNPLSTFSIDVDTASYSNVRRFLNSGRLPPKDAVRVEELLNYFEYDYAAPSDGKPFSPNFEITEAPWKPEHRLLRIGLKARDIAKNTRPPGNLVFLLDVSGSMDEPNKLPLVKQSMLLLLDQLTEKDRVAIVVYAGTSGLALPSTSGSQKQKIREAIDGLEAGGSTNGASGIQLAYQTAQENFIPGGVNRVILATDGDFNIGITNRGDLTRLIEEKSKTGIFLTILGFGMGNYKDSTLETLSGKGNGNYAYIDELNEAKKVLVEQINGTLVTVAKDVKVQIEFNPRMVGAYRLIGYEDRVMAKEDFNDDAKDAGDMGAGHVVTVLYEIVPAGMKPPGTAGVDPLKYQEPTQLSSASVGNEILTMKIRYKEPDQGKSVVSEFSANDSGRKFSEGTQDYRFAAAVAAFGMVLRDSPHKGSATLDAALEWAKQAKGPDRNGYREEFIRLIHRAISMRP
jgi:Ca-activated chloride channel family protein